MASTYTNNIGLEMPAAGDYPSSWAAMANTQYSLIDTAISAITSVVVTGSSDITLTSLDGTADQARAMVLVMKGTPTAQIQVLVPNGVTKHYDLRSKVTNSQTIIVNNAGGPQAGCTIAPSECFSIYTDGQQCRKLGVVPKGTIMFWTGTTSNVPAGWQYYSTMVVPGVAQVVYAGNAPTPVSAVDPVVSIGTPGSGTTGSTTLTVAEMPAHNHISGWTASTVFQSGADLEGAVRNVSSTVSTSNTGGGGSHSHTLAGTHTHPIGVTPGFTAGYALIPIRKYT